MIIIIVVSYGARAPVPPWLCQWGAFWHPCIFCAALSHRFGRKRRGLPGILGGRKARHRMTDCYCCCWDWAGRGLQWRRRPMMKERRDA